MQAPVITSFGVSAGNAMGTDINAQSNSESDYVKAVNRYAYKKILRDKQGNLSWKSTSNFNNQTMLYLFLSGAVQPVLDDQYVSNTTV